MSALFKRYPADLTNHYLDTNIIIQYLDELHKRREVVADYMMRGIYFRCTSTCPYEECWKVFKDSEDAVLRFFQFVKDKQTLESGEATCNLEAWKKKYYHTWRVSQKEKGAVDEYVDRYGSYVEGECAEGVSSELIAVNCSKEIVESFILMRNKLEAVVFENDDAEIRLFNDMPQESIERSLNTEHAKGSRILKIIRNRNDVQILLEAQHVADVCTDSGKICVVTADREHLIENRDSKELKKLLHNVSIYRPDEIPLQR